MKIDEGNQISANKLLQMNWYNIIRQGLVDELFTTVWCEDTMLNELLYKNKFNISPGKAFDSVDNAANKMISFWTMWEKYSGFTDKKLFMEFLLRTVFADYKDATIECAIKYIKANLITALLVSESLTQIFSNTIFDIKGNACLEWEFPRNLSWSVFDGDPPANSILHYVFQLTIRKFNKNPARFDLFKPVTVEIGNPWLPIKWAKIDDIKDKTLNEIMKDAPIFISIGGYNNYTKIEDLAKAIKYYFERVFQK